MSEKVGNVFIVSKEPPPEPDYLEVVRMAKEAVRALSCRSKAKTKEETVS